MKFFANPEKAAEKKLAETTASRDALTVRLVAAQGAVAESNAALQRLAVQNADDATLGAGEAKLRDAERRVATLAPALAEIETLLATLEADRAEMLDKKQRDATHAKVFELADELVEVAAAYDASTAALADVCTRALTVSNDMSGMAVFTAASRTEVGAAIPTLAEVLRAYGRQVLNREMPAEYPLPEVPFVPEIVTKPATKHLFALRGISWKENGVLRVAQKFTDVDLPVKYAAKALKTNACCEIDSPLRNKSTLNQWGGHLPPESCFSLDGEPVTDIAEPREIVQHSAFEIVDRGPSYTLRVASGGA
jgi:hypothetical protein